MFQTVTTTTRSREMKKGIVVSELMTVCQLFKLTSHDSVYYMTVHIQKNTKFCRCCKYKRQER